MSAEGERLRAATLAVEEHCHVPEPLMAALRGAMQGVIAQTFLDGVSHGMRRDEDGGYGDEFAREEDETELT